MRHFTKAFTALPLVLLLVTALGCGKKLSEAALAAQEDAKTANAKVAALEQQIAEIKSGKTPSNAADPATAEHVSKAQAKALERQLQSAKKSAESKRKLAEELATAPTSSAPKPVIVDVPEGTPFPVAPVQELTTSTVHPGDTWDGSLTQDVIVAGKTVWKAGTPVSGVVTQSTPAGRLSSGQGSLGIKVTRLGSQDVDTAAYVVVGDKRGARNAKFIGGGAALGALIGIMSDRRNQGDHALGGAAIGAAAGTAAAAATADTVIKIPAEKPITFSLAASEKVILKP